MRIFDSEGSFEVGLNTVWERGRNFGWISWFLGVLVNNEEMKLYYLFTIRFILSENWFRLSNYQDTGHENNGQVFNKEWESGWFKTKRISSCHSRGFLLVVPIQLLPLGKGKRSLTDTDPRPVFFLGLLLFGTIFFGVVTEGIQKDNFLLIYR